MVYGPLRDMPVDPTVILLRLNGKQPMLMLDARPRLRFEGKPQCLEAASGYLGIFGFRYGWIPEAWNKSITELECDWALYRLRGLDPGPSTSPSESPGAFRPVPLGG